MWGIEVDYRYSASILLLIPIIWYGIQSVKRDNIFIFLILTLAFCEGIFDITLLTASNNRLLRDFLILLFFTIRFHKTINFRFKFVLPVLLMILISFISMLLNKTSITQYLLFSRRVFFPIILFWSIYNSQFEIDKNNKFIKYIIYLYIIQIVFSVYKLFLIGLDENYIGSISIRGGSLTTIYTLMGSAVAFIYFLYFKQKKYLFLIFGFLFFGIVGGKRAIVIFLPILLYIIFYFYIKSNNKGLNINFLKVLFSVVFFSIIFSYIIVITNPSLNPENKVGGSFDIVYVTDYMNSYNNDDRKGLGRQSAPEFVLNLMGSKGFEKILLGFGPGDIISSSVNKKKGVNGDEELVMQKYDLWYGSRTGFLWTSMQIGILGLTCYILFFIAIFRQFKKAIHKEYKKPLFLALLAFIIIFFIDYFTYSATFTYSNVFTYILFVFMGIGLKEYDNIKRTNLTH